MMQSTMPKKILIALPPAMVKEIDLIAKCEHRSRSDLVRESLRRYIDAFKRNQTIIADTRIKALTANGTE